MNNIKLLALILFNNIYKLQIDMVERLIFNKPLPRELIIHIYSFDPTYKEYYNKCIDEINEAITKATGLKKPDFDLTVKSFNEYNSEPSKDGYTRPRGSR